MNIIMNYCGQHIITRLLHFLDKSKISRSSKVLGADKSVKRFTSDKYVVVMFFAAFEDFNSILETLLSLLSNTQKLQHLGLDNVVRRSTLSEANARRSSKIFTDAHYNSYKRFSGSLTDIFLSKTAIKCLYIMDSTTITLFKDIHNGFNCNPVNWNKKGGIKAHTVIHDTEAAKHDHLLQRDVEMPHDSIHCFEKRYVDYAQHEGFTSKKIWYVTRLKVNALYEAREEFDIHDETDSGVMKDEQDALTYGKKKSEMRKSRRLTYWDFTNGRLFEFITNNIEFTAEDTVQIYKKIWQIKQFFKQLKHFQGSNEKAFIINIFIQTWSVMLANLLLLIVKSKIQWKWAFSNMISVVGQHQMSYISANTFFESPAKAWQELIEEQKTRIKEIELNNRNQLSLNWEKA